MRYLYLLPYDGIGGVESAARSLQYHPSAHLISLAFISSRSSTSPPSNTLYIGPFVSESNPLNYFSLLFYLFSARPDVLIASLWRSTSVAIIFKIFLPRARIITFLHLPTSVHLIDRVVNTLSCLLSYQIWVDSYATLASRVPQSLHYKSHVITHLANHLAPVCFGKLSPSFVFWGRITRQKNLPYAFSVFRHLKAAFPSATFTIIGPNSSYKSWLINRNSNLLSDSSLRVYSGLSLEKISEIVPESSFFLNTSDIEGMCMSVVEAMQFGLVPIVTPVGEIANYTRHMYNSIHISDPLKILEDVSYLFEHPSAFYDMRSNSINTWRAHPLYRDQFFDHLTEIPNF